MINTLSLVALSGVFFAVLAIVLASLVDDYEKSPLRFRIVVTVLFGGGIFAAVVGLVLLGINFI